MTYSALRPRARVYRVYMLVPWAVLPALSCYLPVVLGFSAHVGSVGSRCGEEQTEQSRFFAPILNVYLS